jgi:hypothetical protein
MCWQITKLKDDSKVLDCLTKSKEVALLVAKRTMQKVEAKSLHGG